MISDKRFWNWECFLARRVVLVDVVEVARVFFGHQFRDDRSDRFLMANN